MTRIAVQQLAPTIGDLDANAGLAVGAIREAAEAGAEVVVLPELLTSGYLFADAQECAAAAIAPDHDILRAWAAEAARGGLVVVGGFCEAGPDGKTYNSAAVIDQAGELRAVYRKLHLWDGEKRLFAPGAGAPPVVETRAGRVGVVICYDLEFPELTRAVALAGADLLAVPTNWPLVPRPDGERPPEAVVAMGTARVNRMAVACADRLGTERGLEWTGGSSIVGVDGWVVAETHAVGMVVADVDLAAARDKQLTELAHAFGDRRPEMYKSVAG
ncbi:(R)-stereoselective amidase [Baekduia alba]|uniref:nitrilase-related carbon-nitrogen hydrolase n=1 Tax=Baekduia alba TaxID=2997333 RepID=UPI00233FFFF4|nr:nitrilase-related carbon-nitrogen hydrolase [Baekduia alba]WCB96790.1 (R)-stereoselective amidase [Baekduia alba]